MINYYISIVLYNYKINDILILLNKINNYNSNHYIYLIDNSNTDNKNLFQNFKNVIYVKTLTNIGYGRGHNLTIKDAINNNIKYCFILNYDISFNDSVFVKLKEYVDNHNDVAMIMPRILNNNKSPQWLPKLQPTPLSIFKRKLNQISKNLLFRNYVANYEFRKIDFNKNYNIPNLSGCFFLLNINLLKEEALFDERFFLYFEDYDLSRRITTNYKTILYNKCFVFHDYQSTANKNIKVLLIFIQSYIKYFNKWGWFKSKNLKILNDKLYVVN